jgi:hypothetical protein
MDGIRGRLRGWVSALWPRTYGSLGGTARMVMLPKELHSYRARESILHMLAEIDFWLEQFVKNAKPAPNVVNPPATRIGTLDSL